MKQVREDKWPPQGSTFASAGGTLSSFTGSWRALLDSFLHLVTLEGKRAGVSLALMLGFGLAAAVLLITGWLALLACIVVALAENDIVGWPVALVIAALLSFAGSGALVILILQRSQDLLFVATRRQLRGDPVPETQGE